MSQSDAEWMRGWPVVAAGVFGMIAVSLHMGPVGVVMTPLSDELGWSRAQISAGMTIIALSQLALAPLASVIIPRFGARSVALAGAGIYCAGAIMLACCTAEVWTWYAGCAVLAIGTAAAGPMSWTTAITRGFARNRGVALAIALCGTGISTTLTPAIAVWALHQGDWRLAFFALAGLCGFVLAPAIWLLTRHRPEFAPFSVSTRSSEAQKPARIFTNVKTWQMVLCAALLAATVGALTVHMQAILRDAGITADRAAAYFAVIGPSLIVGRIVAGALLDRLPARLVATVMFLSPAAACIILLNYDGSTELGLLACVLFGLGFGAETDILAYLVSRYFGVDQYAAVYGWVYGMFSAGYGLAALGAGAAFDLLGSYQQILMLLIAGASLAVGLMLALGPTPPRPAHVATAA